MTITEKAAYLRGLVEGQGQDPEAGEGKLWHVLSELISDIAGEMAEIRKGQEDLEDSLEEVQVGLDYLEEFLQDDYDYEIYDDDEDDISVDYYPFGDTVSAEADGEEADKGTDDED